MTMKQKKNVYNIGNEIKFVIKLKEGEKSNYNR